MWIYCIIFSKRIAAGIPIVLSHARSPPPKHAFRLAPGFAKPHTTPPVECASHSCAFLHISSRKLLPIVLHTSIFSHLCLLASPPRRRDSLSHTCTQTHTL